MGQQAVNRSMLQLGLERVVPHYIVEIVLFEVQEVRVCGLW